MYFMVDGRYIKRVLCTGVETVLSLYQVLCKTLSMASSIWHTRYFGDLEPLESVEEVLDQVH